MKELVGYCSACSKAIYCKDGFLDGVVIQEENILLCFICQNKRNESYKFGSRLSE
jgi:hypothetical protein